MEKQKVRDIMLSKRKEISNKKELSTIIVHKIMNLAIYKKAHVIALYKSLNSEVDTNELINDALFNKIVLLPKILDDKMIFIKVDKSTTYLKSKIGVMEPVGEIYQGNIDLIIVPGISFDKKLNRLGFGKGYYDKYLKDNDIYKIGVCFDKVVTSMLPTNEFDVSMDLVITDKRTIKKV